MKVSVITYKKGNKIPPIKETFRHIYIKSGVRSGKARIGKTRFTVGDLMGYLASGMSWDEVIDDFPFLDREQITEGLRYAQAVLHRYEIEFDRPLEDALSTGK